jgi:uncharacterized short protein YbdD (DUF466 family)
MKGCYIVKVGKKTPTEPIKTEEQFKDDKEQEKRI